VDVEEGNPSYIRVPQSQTERYIYVKGTSMWYITWYRSWYIMWYRSWYITWYRSVPHAIEPRYRFAPRYIHHRCTSQSETYTCEDTYGGGIRSVEGLDLRTTFYTHYFSKSDNKSNHHHHIVCAYTVVFRGVWCTSMWCRYIFQFKTHMEEGLDIYIIRYLHYIHHIVRI